jgi:hypothetical protein
MPHTGLIETELWAASHPIAVHATRHRIIADNIIIVFENTFIDTLF